MGMFDTIYSVHVKCPRCGDDKPKHVQIKCGPQELNRYKFGRDKINIDWDYPYYWAIIDEHNNMIGGIASCDLCKDEAQKKMDDFIQEAKDKGEIKVPEGYGNKYLFECEIDGKSALGVILNRLDDFYGGNRHIEFFNVKIKLENNIPISADVVDKDEQ